MARGKYAYFICDRSGFRFKYSERVREPTGLIVGASETDGRYNGWSPDDSTFTKRGN